MLPLVVIVGPTAVGKTRISVELAQRLGGEIISGDSMQVYRRMDIGTAKIRPEEMKGVRHHLLDIKDPDEPFSVAEFQELAKQAIQDIRSRGKIPLLVGGTGLYVQSIIDPYDFGKQVEVSEHRERLYQEAALKGKGCLHAGLAAVDPEAASKIHPNDLKRTVRALEYFYATGNKISANRNARDKQIQPLYQLAYLGLTMERKLLYKRIDERVDAMMEEGLVEEVKHLREKGYNETHQAMQGLGYRQMLAYLRGEYDLKRAVELIKRDTRRFAKRQLTWFRGDKRINWVEVDQDKNVEEIVREFMGIIGRTITFHVE